MFSLEGLLKNGFYGIYYRGVTFDLTEEELQNFLSKYKYDLEFSTDDKRCNVYCLKYYSEFSPPPSKEIDEDHKAHNQDIYFLVFIVLKCDSVNKCLLGSHSEEILLLITEKEFQSFYLTDISEICNKNYCLTDKYYLSISRLSASNNIEAAEEITRMIFHGKNILDSKTIKLIMGQKDVTEKLFTKVSRNQEKFPVLLPNSCQLLFNDGRIKFALNSDRFGNFSFIITKEYKRDFYALAHIFMTITNMGCFVFSNKYNPLKRSARALKEIESNLNI